MPELEGEMRTTHSKPVHLKMAAPTPEFYRVVGRAGVTRCEPKRMNGLLRLSFMLLLSAAAWAAIIGAVWLLLQFI